MTADASSRARELARHYLQVDRPGSALEALARAAERDLEDPEVWALRGWALMELERHADAARTARDALARWPDDTGFLQLLAVAEARRDRLAEAEDAILAALVAAPDAPHLLCTYADTLMRGGQLAKAGDVLDLAVRADPDELLVLRLQLNLAHLRGRDREARALAARLLAEDADDHQAHVTLGSMDLARGDLAGAERRLATAVRHDPSSPGIATAARTVQVMRSPLAWPLLPLERFGPGPSWLAAMAVILGLGAAGLQTASAAGAIVWVVLCVYSWIAGPLLRRRVREGW